jgi:methyltransferase (TIGR00027 family)
LLTLRERRAANNKFEIGGMNLVENNKTSMTALISSFSRAYHAEFDEPKIFYDPIARQLMTDEEYNQIMGYMIGGIDFFAPEKKSELVAPEEILKWVVQTQLAPTPLARARYCEDMVMNAVKYGTKQYVILGAGMDTFAYRNDGLMANIHVFEVDHPDTQKHKIQRVVQAGWNVPDNLHYVPMDFTKDCLADELKRAGFDNTKITFYSWLGVTYYLTKEDIAKILRTIAALSPDGSSLLFDYPDDQFLISDVGRVKNQIAMAGAAGEEMQADFCYAELEKLLSDSGLFIYEHLTTSDISNCFFADRSDYLQAFEHINYVLAVKKE